VVLRKAEPYASMMDGRIPDSLVGAPLVEENPVERRYIHLPREE